MGDLRETAVARHVVEWLTAEGWEVHEEVACGGAVADIVALRRLVHSRVPLIRRIEVKTSLTADLVLQAHDARRSMTSHTVEVAFPHIDGGRRGTSVQAFHRHLLAREGVGVLRVRMDDEVARWSSRVEVESKPRFVRTVEHASDRKLQRMHWLNTLRHTAEFCERHRNLVPAGTNRGGFWTPYKGTMHDVRAFIRQNGGAATLKEIMQALSGAHHYRTDALARRAIPTNLAMWESDWCEVIDGNPTVYRLREGAHG